MGPHEDNDAITRVPEYRAIVSGIEEDLRQRYQQIQVVRDGRLRLTLFRPLEFKFLQVLVGSAGVHVVEDPETKDVLWILREAQAPVDEVFRQASENKKSVHGPFAIEDPSMLKKIHRVIDTWMNKPQS